MARSEDDTNPIDSQFLMENVEFLDSNKSSFDVSSKEHSLRLVTKLYAEEESRQSQYGGPRKQKKGVTSSQNKTLALDASVCNSSQITIAALNSVKNKELKAWGLPELILQKYESQGIKEMFEWQVSCLGNPKVLIECCNLVYSAPTSAGKTLVAEILTIKTLLERQKKVIIILPFVSIVREKTLYMQDILSSSGIRVEGFMGSQSPPGGLQAVHVAICTIEKANSLINKLLDEGTISELGAVIVDEMHLLGDPHRGYILELLLTKVKYVSSKIEDVQIQIVGMSATLPNLEVLARWLEAELFITSFRPIPLDEYCLIGSHYYNREGIHVATLDQGTGFGTFGNDSVLQICFDTIKEGCSILIFCMTKNRCESLSQHIAASFYKLGSSGNNLGSVLREQLNTGAILEVLEQLKSCPVGLDHVLKNTISFGVAYHHAGLTFDERDIIEASFKSGAIRVLVATSTLSSGVNLPARKVIIRTPVFLRKSLNILTYKQMIGRAGRMGRDSKGESILICTNSEKEIGLNLMLGDLEPVTSCIDNDDKFLRIILEIIASGVACTDEELDLYVKCTLLFNQKDISETLLKETLLKLIEYELIRCQDSACQNRFVATSLGKACLCSSMAPNDGLSLFFELQTARECIVLETDLHLLYLVTPYSVSSQWADIDWLHLLTMYQNMSKAMKRVADLIGVTERYIIRRMQHGGNVGSDAKAKDIIHKRFYTALALQDLVNEVPLSEVATKYECARGFLQSLQQAAATFAGMVTCFCHQLGWKNLEMLVAQFQDRLHFGIHSELIELMKLPSLNGVRARSLFNAGYETIASIAADDCNGVEDALLKALPFQSEKARDSDDDVELRKRNKMKNVWITGHCGMTTRQAAENLILEARKHLQLELGVNDIKWDKTDDPKHNQVYSNEINMKSVDKKEPAEPVPEPTHYALNTKNDERKEDNNLQNKLLNDVYVLINDFSNKTSRAKEDKLQNYVLNDDVEIILVNDPSNKTSRVKEEELQNNVLNDVDIILVNDSSNKTSKVKEDSKLRNNISNDVEINAVNDSSYKTSKVYVLQNSTNPKTKQYVNRTIKRNGNVNGKNYSSNETSRTLLVENITGPKPEQHMNTAIKNEESQKESFRHPPECHSIVWDSLNFTEAGWTNVTKSRISGSTFSPQINFNDSDIKAGSTNVIKNRFSDNIFSPQISFNDSDIEIKDNENSTHNSTPKQISKDVSLFSGDEADHSLFEDSLPIDEIPSKLLDDANEKSKTSSTNDVEQFFTLNTDSIMNAFHSEIIIEDDEDIKLVYDDDENKASEKMSTSEAREEVTELKETVDVIAFVRPNELRLSEENNAGQPLHKKRKLEPPLTIIDPNKFKGSAFNWKNSSVPLCRMRQHDIVLLDHINTIAMICVIEKTNNKKVIGSNVCSKETQTSNGTNELFSMYFYCGFGCVLALNTTQIISLTDFKMYEVIRQWLAKKHTCLRVESSRDTYLALRKHGLEVTSCFDIALAQWFNNTDDLTWRNLLRQYSPTPTPGSIGYHIEKCMAVWQMGEKQMALLLTKPHSQITLDMENQVAIILAQCEFDGVTVDKQFASEIVEIVKKMQEDIETKLYEIRRRRFNLRSPQEVAKFLKIESTRRCITKKSVLMGLGPRAEMVMLWRKLDYILANTLFPLAAKCSLSDDDKIHPKYSMLTATGRMSMQAPNIQNVPRTFPIEMPSKNAGATEYMCNCRNIFIASPGCVLVSADYCQLEMRILTHFCKDVRLTSIMRSPDVDVFKSIAASWCNIPEEDVDCDLRNKAKQLCYGIIYGMGNRSLSASLDITEADANIFMHSFYKTYPAIAEFKKDVLAKCVACGYAETLMKRRRYLPEIQKKDNASRGNKAHAERQAVNTTIQGSAADIAKAAMCTIDNDLRRLPKQKRARLILQMHDELIYEVPEGSKDHFVILLKQAMENTVRLDVPLPVKVKTGPTWGNLNEITKIEMENIVTRIETERS